MAPPPKPAHPAAPAALALACAALLALAFGGCAKTVSTGSFKGEQHDVAQAVANLQSDVTAGDEQKICSNDLASAVVARLGAARGGCKAVIKEQLAEIDSADLTIDSITLAGAGARRTASAKVRSVFAGKKRAATVSLVKQGGKWKVSAVA